MSFVGTVREVVIGEVASEGIGLGCRGGTQGERLCCHTEPTWEHSAGRSQGRRQDQHGAQVWGEALENKGRSMEKTLTWGPRRAKGEGARKSWARWPGGAEARVGGRALERAAGRTEAREDPSCSDPGVPGHL